MKKLLLLLFTAVTLNSFSQKKETEQHLKNIGFKKSEFAYTTEKVSIYPRGFIYSLNQLDSIFYFGCFDSDVKDVEAFFNSSKTSMPMMTTGSKISRGGGEFEDNFFLEHFNLKIDNLKTIKGKAFKLSKKVDYVILYYWKNSIMDNDYYDNFKRIKQITKNNPKLNIHVIAVSTDKP